MSEHTDTAMTRQCRVCHATVPSGEFCGDCGADAAARPRSLRQVLRPATFAVAPRQRVGWPLVTSTMFPHLSDRYRGPFRLGLLLVLAMLVTFSLLRLLGPLITVISLGLPLLFLLYVWRSGAFRDISAPALAISSTLGAGFGAAWWLWTGNLVAGAYGVPLGAGSQLLHTLGIGLATTMVGAFLMVLPAVVVRVMRLPARESLDGFLIGALGALFYSAAGTMAWLAPQFTVGLLDTFGPWRLLEEAFLYGLVDPLTAAAAGGMVGIALWFRPVARGENTPRHPRAVLWVYAGACIGVYLAVYIVDTAELPRPWEMSANVVFTALIMVLLRAGIQSALLHETPDPSTRRPVRCGRCDHTVPDLPFCPECGAATRALSRSARRRRLQAAVGTTVLAAAFVLLGADRSVLPEPGALIGGPFARLLSESTDLGPARSGAVKITAALHHAAAPARLTAWARSHGLSVRWRDGDDWAVIEGTPTAVADAFGVAVRHYRIHDGLEPGRVYHASPRQPTVPRAARAEVSGLGRILSYLPYRESRPPSPPLDVPDGGLLPHQLLKAYNATPLTEAGYTGEKQTVVVFAFDGFDQADMDSFADWFDLPRFTPQVVGGMPDQRRGEATMDLQMIHAVAPDAQLVLVNSRPSVEGGGGFDKLAQLLDSVDRQFPGAVWSFSIGWGCDRLFNAADLAPVRAAVTRALRNGTTAFIAAGDLAGLECKGGQSWSDPPSPDDVGVDAVASIPEMTAVGGTRLSTDAEGDWLAEQSWYNVPLTQGSAGGASVLYERPPWQTVDPGAGPADRRLVPDISAVGDPFTGVKHVFAQQVLVGGGTSQSAPIWAGFAALINEMFAAGGAGPLGNLNPLLYRVARGAAAPSFRDIRLGGNAVTPSGRAGYDMVTGLGSPNVANLAKNILLARAAGR